MAAPRGDGGATKQEILRAIRGLFATRDIASVSIRDIAAEAGVSHGLVQRYFGTREQMISEIIRQEIAGYNAGPTFLPVPAGAAARERWRQDFKPGLKRFAEYAAIIVRAELAGYRPEDMLDPTTETPAEQLAAMIATMQLQAGLADAPDPRMVSATVNAVLFAFATMSPWLMASVGMPARSYEAHLDDVIDAILGIIECAVG
jgi:AcrR family transcriptional regulator